VLGPINGVDSRTCGARETRRDEPRSTHKPHSLNSFGNGPKDNAGSVPDRVRVTIYGRLPSKRVRWRELYVKPDGR
jgi:hypothetical protein